MPWQSVWRHFVQRTNYDMFVDYQTRVVYIFNSAVAVTIGLPDEQFWAGDGLSQVQSWPWNRRRRERKAYAWRLTRSCAEKYSASGVYTVHRSTEAIIMISQLVLFNALTRVKQFVKRIRHVLGSLRVSYSMPKTYYCSMYYTLCTCIYSIHL